MAPVFYGEGTLPDKRAVAKARPAPVAVAGTAVVRKGDTLYRISRRHGVSLRGLIVANRLAAPYVISPGDKLRLPRPAVHVVEKGDTIYGISQRYGVDISSLVRLNKVRPPYLLAVGQRLVLPAARSVQTASYSPPPPSNARRPRRTPGKAIGPTVPSRRATIPRPPPRNTRGFLWPIRGTVLSGFGAQGKGLRNDGINIAARRGAPVRAADNGVVAYVGNELRGFGNLLLIKHAGGWMSAYAHNDKLLVGLGDRVRRGQTISRVGSSGAVVRPQLHFELRRGVQAVDPIRYLPRRTAGVHVSRGAGQGGRRDPG